ncbi:hypothetical protein GCM10022237_50220 [Nocardioides ginsengisoli]|uniref:Sulfurtransferase n=1 Tax=Nocardioides ginsengisoli TaxID=363868 RepID=A0ABW3W2D0_9ACTN
MARTDVLVDGDWLEQRPGAPGAPGAIVIEVDENTAAHGVSHIPGSTSLDWSTDLRQVPRRDVVTYRPETTYTAGLADPALRAFRDDVIAGIGVREIVDVRSPAEFSGEILAPAHFPQEQPQVPGHVPTAVNVPWSQAAADDGSFRGDDELRALYGGAGLALDGRPVTVYCRVGERSAHTWFVLHELLDLPDVRNYDGSWVEYGSLIGAPVEV